MIELPPCKKLYLLVGSNPLPNFLAAIVLKPESVCLFFTPESAPVKDKLEQILKNRGLLVSSQGLGHATDSSKVREQFNSAFSVPHEHEHDHLDYTGGTKVMAAHARIAFRDVFGDDWAYKHTSYLDEKAGLLRYDHGFVIAIDEIDIDITVDDVLELHGIDGKRKERVKDLHLNVECMPKEADAQAIANAALDKPWLAGCLYNLNREEGVRRSITDAKRCPVIMSDLVPDMSIKEFPESCWKGRVFEKWCKFIESGWFEIWCGKFVQELAKESEVYVNVNCIRDNGRKFEIDLMVVRNHRLYVISCTTDTTIQLCKSKVFEVAMRSRQLGGDLARSALFCMLYGENEDGLYLTQLEGDVKDIWGASNTPKVFGLKDLKEWAGIDGPSDVSSLKKWLES